MAKFIFPNEDEYVLTDDIPAILRDAAIQYNHLISEKNELSGNGLSPDEIHERLLAARLAGQEICGWVLSYSNDNTLKEYAIELRALLLSDGVNA